MSKKNLAEATKLIQEEHLEDPTRILEFLGYGIQWRGLEMEKATLHKNPQNSTLKDKIKTETEKTEKNIRKDRLKV